MSADNDRTGANRPAAEGEGRRRLRTLNTYPDPYLVTKLPLESEVQGGVIRLSQSSILAFVQKPFPDGTRVRVVYDGWLYADRLDDPSPPDSGAQQSEPVPRPQDQVPENGPRQGDDEEAAPASPEDRDRVSSASGKATATPVAESTAEPLELEGEGAAATATEGVVTESEEAAETAAAEATTGATAGAATEATAEVATEAATEATAGAATEATAEAAIPEGDAVRKEMAALETADTEAEPSVDEDLAQGSAAQATQPADQTPEQRSAAQATQPADQTPEQRSAASEARSVEERTSGNAAATEDAERRSDVGQADLFPDDLRHSEARPGMERDRRQEDAWTDAFKRRDKPEEA